MACVVYQVTTCLLLLVAVRSSGVQPEQIIYVDKGNGAEQCNSTAAIVNRSSKNGTLGTHPTLHPSEMGIGSKYVSEYFQALSFFNFQAFLRRGCTSFNPFLSNLDNSPHLTVPKVSFLLDPFTIVKQKCKNEAVVDALDGSHHGTSCPTWFSSANGTCRCGKDLDGAVRCNSTKEVAILRCYCMTYSESTGPVVGTCFYNCLHSTLQSALYHPLPSNATKGLACVSISTEQDSCAGTARRTTAYQFTPMI